LSDVERERVAELSERLIEEDLEVFPEIDEFFGRLYGLNGLDLEVIRDTLEVCLPYNESRVRANSRPRTDECERFRQRLEDLLRPFFNVMGREPHVELWEPNDRYLGSEAAFRILSITALGHPTEVPNNLIFNEILALANETGATRVFTTVEDGLVVGIINQYRYWTLSRARLLAAEILRRHSAVFERQSDVARVL
jgi:hypothetical protein